MVPPKLIAWLVQVSVVGQFVGLFTTILLTQVLLVAVMVKFVVGSIPIIVFPTIVPELMLIVAFAGTTLKATEYVVPKQIP